MKKSIFLFLIAALAVSSSFSQCINCDSSFSSIPLNSSTIGKLDTASGSYSLAAGYSCKASGHSSIALGYKCQANNVDSFFSMAFGYQSTASGRWSIAGGTICNASGRYSIALGEYASAEAQNNIAIGKSVTSNSNYDNAAFTFGSYLTNSGPYSMVLGSGLNHEFRLENDIRNCMMIGFYSTVPTFYIGPSNSSELEPDRTGKVGIGNITSPQAKLHIKSDADEASSLFLEPSIWTTESNAELFLGNLSNGISAEINKGLVFKTENNYLLNQGNIGIGTEEPAAKVHIKSGDIYIEDIDRGIIMKSPDGTCWRGTLNNQGQLTFEILDECPENTIVSLKEPTSNKLDIRIHPNPAENIIEIEIPEIGSQSIALMIVDENGKVVKSMKLTSIKTTVNIADLAPGLYFGNFTGEQVYFVEKFIKL